MQKFDSIDQIILEIETLKFKGEIAKAISILENNIMEYNDDYRFFEELGDIYLAEGIVDKAEKAVDFALKLNPESATGNYLKGFLYINGEEPEKAIPFLEKSNKLMTNNSEVLRNLGYAYAISGQYEKGIYILKRAQFINPEDYLIKEDLAMALIGSGEVLEGNAILRQVRKNEFI
ncbi:MAG: hypothetical protein Q9M94_02480 [Candidatus Gracilibacteria bacterium]|nr:hypothetical protein [Candidatus Gracilibacteria bacterium]